MDETQRNIAATLGVGLMLGAIAWIPATATLTRWPFEIVVILPIVMFVVGIILVMFAWRGNKGGSAFDAKDLLKRGETLVGIPMSPPKINLIAKFQDDGYLWMKEHHGLSFAERWDKAMDGQSPELGVDVQVELLKKLKHPRWYRRDS